MLRSLAMQDNKYKVIHIDFNTLKGFPDFNIAGLKTSLANEIKYKFKSQIISAGFKYPPIRKIASFHPSSLSAQAQLLEVSALLGFLIKTNQIKYKPQQDTLFVGSLDLHGRSLKAHLDEKLLSSAKEHGFKNLFMPKANLSDWITYKGLNIIAYSSLKDLIVKLEKYNYQIPIEKLSSKEQNSFDQIVNNYFAKKLIVLGVGSFSNTLVVGEPGVGKTLLLDSIREILPIPTSFYKRQIMTDKSQHPFYQFDSAMTKTDILASKEGLSLYEKANVGVVGVNEFNQLSKKVLELFKSSLDDKSINYKGNKLSSLHAFVATMNPCKCGYSNSKNYKCICNDYSKKQFIQKLGLPLLDRFDLFIDFNSTSNPYALSKTKQESSSATNQIAKLFDWQSKNGFITKKTYQDLSGLLTEKSRTLLEFSAGKLSMSMRRKVKTMRLSLAISILQDKEVILPEHIYEALTYQKFYYDLLEKKDAR